MRITPETPEIKPKSYIEHTKLPLSRTSSVTVWYCCYRFFVVVVNVVVVDVVVVVVVVSNSKQKPLNIPDS